MEAGIYLVLFSLLFVRSGADPPNILHIMSDDIGPCDLQTCDPFMVTPNLADLEKEGVVMTQSYTLQACTPTRTALLTGRYPYKTGLYIGKIKGAFLRWLPEKEILLPASLKRLNYTTHLIGKWHLGYCNWNITPMFRGFDSFYGFYSGAQGFFSHQAKKKNSYDFRDGHRVAWENQGNYSTFLHTERALKIIRNKNHRPFYLYLAYQNAHAPFEAHPYYENVTCKHVQEKTRRIHCAMVAAMDDGIGQVVRALKRAEIFNNTLIVYSSDNGGPLGDGAYNYPYRGGKASLWEGGTLQRTIVTYPNGMSASQVNNQWPGLFHVTDWYKTLYRAAGGDPNDLHEMDSIDQFEPLMTGGQSLRTEMIYNIDPTHDRAAIRINEMKYLKGRPAHSKNGSSIWAPPDMVAHGMANTTFLGNIPNGLYNLTADPTERKNLYKRTMANNGTILFQKLQEMINRLNEEDEKVIHFVVPERAKMADGRYYSGANSPGWCSLNP